MSESEDGGVQWLNGRPVFDFARREDWAMLASICPVGAIEIAEEWYNDEVGDDRDGQDRRRGVEGIEVGRRDHG
ncbi:MAG: hypothetical protein IJ668_10015 [Selenomonadaceae bacterium]|nr:hypothetical protein [Selenomonadaceae bacterium]